MDISNIDEVCGLAIKRVRDALKKLSTWEFTEDSLRDALKLKPSERHQIIDDFIAVDLIMVADPEQEPGSSRVYYTLTDEGQRLSNAVLLKRISRKKADEIVQLMVLRARDINARPELTHRVSMLRVFGSYASDRQDLGDIDVAVTLKSRFADGEATVAASLERADASSKNFNNYAQKLFYGQHEVQQLLKNRSPYISIHSGEEIEKLGVDYKAIFRDDA